MIISESPAISKYKEQMMKSLSLYYPDIHPSELSKAVDYSISKRFKDSECAVNNSYTKRTANMTLLKLTDYIMSKEPIVTSMGTMFKHHGEVPNPTIEVIKSFLANRKKHKKIMFSFPKGSEDFEKYNLLQQLDKIDANGTYGTIGQYTSLLYNVNVASSITAQGRSAISSASLCFESILNNSVKFGSVDEVLEFIIHVKEERNIRKFNDRIVLDNNITVDDCFAKLIFSCGYRWMPDDEEMDIIYKVVQNLDQEDLNRVYYKNNLYYFCDNRKIFNIIRTMLKKLKRPLYFSGDIPDEIKNDIKLFADLVGEYVYSRYMYIDRTDRCANMIKSVIAVSDTDSCIVSLDGWYRYVVNQINGESFIIANYTDNPIIIYDKDEDGNWVYDKEPVYFEKQLDYDFMTDEISERERFNDPATITPNDNVKYSIINIIAYVLDKVVNDYMDKMCSNMHSLINEKKTIVETSNELYNISIEYGEGNSFFKIVDGKPKGSIAYTYNKDCVMRLKNEFTFARIMMTDGKKHYSSLQTVQEGNLIPEEKQLDIKGIDILYKSSTALSTRKALQKILLEDIMKADKIDQLRIIKDAAIFEKSIIESLRNGSKQFFKPMVVKSANHYDNPMQQQGIKASVAWNTIRPDIMPALNMEQRNAVDIVKVKIDKNNVERIADRNPDVYNNMLKCLAIPEFKNIITAIAIPSDMNVPEWMMDFIDYDSIIRDNLAGFPWEAVGIRRMDKKNVNYTNIVQL